MSLGQEEDRQQEPTWSLLVLSPHSTIATPSFRNYGGLGFGDYEGGGRGYLRWIPKTISQGILDCAFYIIITWKPHGLDKSLGKGQLGSRGQAWGVGNECTEATNTSCKEGLSISASAVCQHNSIIACFKTPFKQLNRNPQGKTILSKFKCRVSLQIVLNRSGVFETGVWLLGFWPNPSLRLSSGPPHPRDLPEQPTPPSAFKPHTSRIMGLSN